jgi:hypothetical protein
MTQDCNWIDAKIESYFTDTLSGDELRTFHNHVATCNECSGKVESFTQIDTLVRGAFQRRLAIARLAAQTDTRSRVFKISLTAAGLTAAAVLVATWLTFVPQPAPPTTVLQPPPVPALQNDVKKNEASGEGAQTRLSKPGDGLPAATAVDPSLDPNSPVAPDFAITDAAGYTTGLDAYKGHALLFGVLTRDQKSAVAGMQQIYDSFAHNREIRIVGISRRGDESLDSVTFPMFFNHGSKLMGVADGEYLLLDSTGKTRLKGSLASAADLGKLRSEIDKMTAR